MRDNNLKSNDCTFSFFLSRFELFLEVRLGKPDGECLYNNK